MYFQQKVRIIESVNIIIVNITLSFRTCTQCLAAANVNDKEGGNSPSSLASQSSSPSHHVKRSANGPFTKHGAKGTPKNVEHVRRGYQNYIAQRKLEFGNCIDENEPTSKRETRSTQAATEREAAIPRGNRFIDLDVFRESLQSCTHCQSGKCNPLILPRTIRNGLSWNGFFYLLHRMYTYCLICFFEWTHCIPKNCIPKNCLQSTFAVFCLTAC